MDPTAAMAALLREFGPIMTVTALLAGLVQQLVKHILHETVGKDIYEHACQTHGKIESAVDNLATGVNEIAHGQSNTNKMLEILLKNEVGRR